jgi:hypothetical protein
MTFESELFKTMRDVYPDLTVRTFSVILGKSEGYWSSITTQGLSVSTDAMVNLFDAIYVRKLLLDAESASSKHLSVIQQMIQSELVNRFLDRTGIELSSEKRVEQDECYGALPFVYSMY